MRNSRMLRIFFKQWLEDSDGLFLFRVSCISRGRHRDQRQGVENLALGIVAIPFGKLTHRCGIAINAGAVGHRIVRVNETYRSRKIAVALGTAELSTPLNSLPPRASRAR